MYVILHRSLPDERGWTQGCWHLGSFSEKRIHGFVVETCLRQHSKWSGIPSPKSTIGIKDIRACTRIRIKDLMLGLDATYMEYVFNLCLGWAPLIDQDHPFSRSAGITLGTVVCDDSRTNQQDVLSRAMRVHEQIQCIIARHREKKTRRHTHNRTHTLSLTPCSKSNYLQGVL